MACFNRVLLVEDDPITSLVCERIIKLTFFSEIIITFNNGEEALVFIKEQRVVLLKTQSMLDLS